jgi:hypothetical protein
VYLLNISPHFVYVGFKTPFPIFLKRQPADLAAWSKYYRSNLKEHLTGDDKAPATYVLFVLQRFDSDLSQVQAAVSNPNAFYPIDYKVPLAKTIYSQLAMLNVSETLWLRAVAELEVQRADLAEKDFLFALDLNRPLERKNFLLAFLIAMADRAFDNAILWEGIRRHAWSDSELHEMESALAAMDELSAGKEMLRNERAGMLQMMNVNVRRSQPARSEGTFFLGMPYTYFLYRPSGWWDEDQTQETRLYQSLIDSIDTGKGTMKKVETKPDQGGVAGFLHFMIAPMSSVSGGFLNSFISKLAESETESRLAAVACLLEEFYSSHKEYPVTLGDLPDLPDRLNREVLTGRPLHYQRKGAGYSLYSTGWDETDHGGTPQTSYPSNDGHYDWVWPSP